MNIFLNDFFEEIGYIINDLTFDFEMIENYKKIYTQTDKNFYNYYQFNGEKIKNKVRYSTQIIKKTCENFADFIFNERVKLDFGSEKNNEILDKFLEKENFFVKTNQGIEKTFALGTGAMLISAEINMEKTARNLSIQFINATNIIPMSYNSETIIECAFITDYISKIYIKKNKIGNLEKVKKIQIHKLDNNKNYIIEEYALYFKENKLANYELLEKIETKSKEKWFVILKPNIVNNMNLNSPFGLPIYANSLDIIKGLDICYDSLIKEVNNGRKRLFVNQEAMKYTQDGKYQKAFDPAEDVFYLLEQNYSQKSTNELVQEVNGNLRVDELVTAIQTNLEILSMKIGFGANYMVFKNTRAKTATEVRAENLNLIKTILKHEQVIKKELKNFLENLIIIANKYKYFKTENIKLKIDFYNSILSSEEEAKNQDREDVKLSLMTIEEYKKKWHS